MYNEYINNNVTTLIAFVITLSFHMREREKEKEKERNRQTDKQTDRQKDRQKGTFISRKFSKFPIIHEIEVMLQALNLILKYK